MSRMLLIEKGCFVVLRNGAGVEVGFSTFDEFLRYCPVAEFGFDPTGKTYLDYEPLRGIHIDEAAGFRIGGQKVEAVKEYEDLIDSVEVIRARQADPLYGKTLAEAKPIQREVVGRNADAELLGKFSLTELLAIAVGARVAEEGLKAAVSVIESARFAAVGAIDAATTIEEVKAANTKAK